MRDINTLVPEAAIGFESQPGHQAQPNRGCYNAGRPSSGLWTYGGTGAFAVAVVSRPGKDFDGSDLTQDDFKERGKYEDINDYEDPKKVFVGRPGIRTMWDALFK